MNILLKVFTHNTFSSKSSAPSKYYLFARIGLSRFSIKLYNPTGLKANHIISSTKNPSGNLRWDEPYPPFNILISPAEVCVPSWVTEDVLPPGVLGYAKNLNTVEDSNTIYDALWAIRSCRLAGTVSAVKMYKASLKNGDKLCLNTNGIDEVLRGFPSLGQKKQTSLRIDSGQSAEDCKKWLTRNSDGQFELDLRRYKFYSSTLALNSFSVFEPSAIINLACVVQGYSILAECYNRALAEMYPTWDYNEMYTAPADFTGNDVINFDFNYLELFDDTLCFSENIKNILNTNPSIPEGIVKIFKDILIFMDSAKEFPLTPEISEHYKDILKDKLYYTLVYLKYYNNILHCKTIPDNITEYTTPLGSIKGRLT